MTALLAQAASSREWYDGWQLVALFSIAFAVYAKLLVMWFDRKSKFSQNDSKADPKAASGKLKSDTTSERGEPSNLQTEQNKSSGAPESANSGSFDAEVIWGKTFYNDPNENVVARMHSDEPRGYNLSLEKTEEGGFVCHLDKGLYKPIASFSVPDGMGSVMADVDRAVLEDYKIRQQRAAETEKQVSSVFADAKRATWVKST